MFKGRSKASKLLRQLQLRQLSEVEEPEPVRQDYLSECHRTYSCIHCRAHLANHDELISKLFQGNHGRAYLFNKVLNVGCKQAVERELLTGLHAVADIYCDCCETTLGWKYEQAFVPSQKYKEGKYIIELVHMLKENNWDLTSYNSEALLEEQQQLDAELAVSSSSGSTNNADVQCGRREQQPAGEGLPVFGPSQGRHCVAGAAGAMTPPARASRRALLAKRANISSSSSYTTINLRPPVEGANFSNLNSSGASSSGGASCSSGESSGAEASASGSSSGSSSSSSSENLDGQASGPAARKATTTTTIGNDDDDDAKAPAIASAVASAVAGRAAAQPSAVQ